MSRMKTLGHSLVAGIFIINGYGAFAEPGARVTMVDQAGIPAPRQAVIFNGVAMVVGGTALAVGFLPKLAALGLIGSLVPTTFVGHPFWQETTPQARAMQRGQFLKNLSMIGGLLLVLLEKD